jgi:AraC-like DNA-binding protein
MEDDNKMNAVTSLMTGNTCSEKTAESNCFVVNEKPFCLSGGGKYIKSSLTHEQSESIINNLNRLMQEEQRYRDSDLKLPVLAAELDVSINHLSQAINQCFGKNFYSFVNDLRIDHVKKALCAVNTRAVSIVDIAKESGFRSKSCFYAVFRKKLNMTPMQFVRSIYRNK